MRREAGKELLLSAAIQWYQQGLISGGKAAEVLGMHRMDFYDELSKRHLDVTDVETEQMLREMGRG